MAQCADDEFPRNFEFSHQDLTKFGRGSHVVPAAGSAAGWHGQWRLGLWKSNIFSTTRQKNPLPHGHGVRKMTPLASTEHGRRRWWDIESWHSAQTMNFRETSCFHTKLVGILTLCQPQDLPPDGMAIGGWACEKATFSARPAKKSTAARERQVKNHSIGLDGARATSLVRY